MLCGIQENTLKAYHSCKSNKKLIQYLRQNGFVHNLYLVAYVELPSKKQLQFHSSSVLEKKESN